MSDQPISVNLSGDLTPISEGLKGNLESMPNAIQKIFITIFGKKYADQIYYQIIKAAQAKVDANKILSGKAKFVNDELIDTSVSCEDYPGPLEMMKQEEENNLTLCILEAIKDSFTKSDDASEEHVSSKFFSRWRREAAHASTIEDRQLWGRILSEENHHPGTFSLRTLDILKNMDCHTGQLFEKICDYIISDNAILVGLTAGPTDQSLQHRHVSNANLGILANVGLLSQNSVADVFLNKSNRIILSLSNYIIILNTNAKLYPTLRPLTESGKQLYKIARNIDEIKVVSFCNSILNSNVIPDLSEIHFYDKDNPVMIDNGKVQTKIVCK